MVLAKPVAPLRSSKPRGTSGALKPRARGSTTRSRLARARGRGRAQRGAPAELVVSEPVGVLDGAPLLCCAPTEDDNIASPAAPLALHKPLAHGPSRPPPADGAADGDDAVAVDDAGAGAGDGVVLFALPFVATLEERVATFACAPIPLNCALPRREHVYVGAFLGGPGAAPAPAVIDTRHERGRDRHDVLESRMLPRPAAGDAVVRRGGALAACTSSVAGADVAARAASAASGVGGGAGEMTVAQA